MASDLALVSSNGMDQQDMASELVESSTQAANEILVPSAPNAEKDMASEVVESSTQPANEILVPSAPNTESVVDIVAPPDLPSEAPRSPGGVSQISMNSRPGRDACLVWQSVFCPICSFEYGQYKYDPHPGQRDLRHGRTVLQMKQAGLLSLLQFKCSTFLCL